LLGLNASRECLPTFCTEASALAELLSSASRTDRTSGAHLIAACRTVHGGTI